MKLAKTIASELNKHFAAGAKLRGAEIGVFKAETSLGLLILLPTLELTMVDQWKEIDKGTVYSQTGDGVTKLSQQQFDEIYELVCDSVAIYRNRVTVMRMPSTEAAALIDDASLDFVFIDAEHTEEAVREDIAAWYPKVKPGGLILGHDYGHRRFPGVAVAADEFAASVGQKVVLCGNKIWRLTGVSARSEDKQSQIA